MSDLQRKVKINFITSVFSIVFALVGFSYNVWRVQESEHNNTIRLASFKVLNELAKYEQILYASFYDKNLIEGSPRKAWVKIGLIVDLSQLISRSVETKSKNLEEVWKKEWEEVSTNEESVERLVTELDKVRKEIKMELTRLE